MDKEKLDLQLTSILYSVSAISKEFNVPKEKRDKLFLRILDGKDKSDGILAKYVKFAEWDDNGLNLRKGTKFILKIMEIPYWKWRVAMWKLNIKEFFSVV